MLNAALYAVQQIVVRQRHGLRFARSAGGIEDDRRLLALLRAGASGDIFIESVQTDHRAGDAFLRDQRNEILTAAVSQRREDVRVTQLPDERHIAGTEIDQHHRTAKTPYRNRRRKQHGAVRHQQRQTLPLFKITGAQPLLTLLNQFEKGTARPPGLLPPDKRLRGEPVQIISDNDIQSGTQPHHIHCLFLWIIIILDRLTSSICLCLHFAG